MARFSAVSRRLFPAIFIGVFYFTPGRAQVLSPSHTPQSQWAYLNPQGTLTYKTIGTGDKIMDFSYAGYRGGGICIPSVAVKITVSPAAGDNTDAIQQAIDRVSEMPLVNGLRGAILLRPGTYNCGGALVIKASGVVLRGSGPGGDGTVINMTGKPHACIIIRGNPSFETTGEPATISDAYVPSGSSSFNITDPAGFAAGDTIRIIRPVTAAWVHFMGMDMLVRNGKNETWITGDITTERVIRKIANHTITVEIPLSDSYDAKYTEPSGTEVIKLSTTGELSQAGVEDLRIVSPSQSVTISDGHNRALAISGITDGWARNIEIFNTVNSISITGKRITVDNVSIIHDLPTIGAAKPADLNGSGTQILFNRCHITGDNLFFFATGAKVSGPVVLLNCIFRGNGWIQPHQRWATGLLVDNCQVPDGGIDFMNRGEMGSGHGWAIGWAVAWNCEAKSLLNQRPPGAANWMIGCRGERQEKAMPFNSSPLLPEGIYDANNTPVSPASLYLTQLSKRSGKQALKNIGY